MFYLTKEEAIDNDPSLALYKSVDPKPCKHSRKREKVPYSKEDYRVYEKILPTAKTINDYKQVQEIHQEQRAALALKSADNHVKVTLHYDTTSRSNIDGEWPSLILIFSDKQRFKLRPLFFAYEDRVQIIRLIVETYNRLAAAINTEDDPCSVKFLWEKTTSLMTDSVSKNLHIGEGVAEKLDSNHHPIIFAL